MPSRPVIQILPLGPVSRADLDGVSRAIETRFRCRAEILPTVLLPAHAWRAERTQYDADVLLEYLFDRLPLNVMRLVGLTEADLFADGRNFVFGYAHMRDRVAVFSTRRLRESYWGRDDQETLYRARIDKALVHELGHTFHVPHCEESRCVMHQVEFLWQLDELDLAYCPTCEGSVHAVAALGVSSSTAIFELAGSYMRRRRFERAAATYAEAAAREPTNAHYHNDHGVALLAVGNREAAASAFERAVRLAPASPHGYYNLGIVSRERGDTSNADRYFSHALSLDGDRLAALRYLGILHDDYFRDVERAQKFYHRYRAAGGTDLEVARRLRLLERQAPGAEISLEMSLVTESSAPV
jgi:archaemetzincin